MIKKEFWKEKKNENIPTFHCPICSNGYLVTDQNTFTKLNSDKANTLYGFTADPTDIEYSFSIVAKCNNLDCLEEVLISGTKQLWQNGYEDTFDNETGEPLEIPEGTPKYSDNFIIEYTSVPIFLFDLPDNLDENCKSEIFKSFKLFWQDTNACANKIRVSLEILLNNKLKIVKRQKIKDKRKSTQTNPIYCYKQLTLGERIGKIKSEGKYAKYKTLAEQLKAIKWIGNDGSHTNEKISRQDIIIAYRIYENLLSKLYNDNKEIEVLTKQINKRKK